MEREADRRGKTGSQRKEVSRTDEREPGRAKGKKQSGADDEQSRQVRNDKKRGGSIALPFIPLIGP